MRILFTICGRAGSKGIHNKNLRKFCGKYLAHFSISAIDLFVKQNPDIHYNVVVNSDSQELIDIVSNNGLVSVEVIVRDQSLAGDTVGKIDVVYDCLKKMEERLGVRYDMVVDLDITSPLRTVNDLEKVIRLQTESHADVTTTVAPARRNPFFNQVMRVNRGVKKVITSNYTARQQAPEIYDMNASIYAYSPAFLRYGKAVLDGYCEVVEMYDTGILDLDHENDFELMEVIAKYLFETRDDFRKIYEHIL